MENNFSDIGPTCLKIEDMIDFARPIIQRWPPLYRYTLGEEIYRQMITLLRLATKARLKHYSKTTLQELDTEKEILKVFVRQANRATYTDKSGKERKVLSDHTYGVWAEKLAEIGRLIGGWIQSIMDREKKS